MGILANIFKGTAGTVVKEIAGAIDEYKLTKEERAELELKTQEIILGHFSTLQNSVQARYAAVRGIIEAEMQQGDAFTKRARPMVVYVGLALFVVEYLAGWLCTANGWPVPPKINEEFIFAWAGVVGVWSLGRSYEKVKGPGGVSTFATGSRGKGAPDEL